MIKINGRRIVYLLALCLSVYHVPGYSDENPRKVELAFNWPLDISGVVTTAVQTTEWHGQEKNSSTVSFLFKVTTAGHTDGLLVTHFDKEFKVLASSDKKAISVEYPRDSLYFINTTMLISPAGKLVDLVNVEEKLASKRHELEQSSKRLIKQLSDVEQQQFYKDLDMSLSKNSVFEVYKRSWNNEIAQWNGLSLDMDKSIKVERSTKSLLSGDTELPTSGEYGFMGRSLCRPYHREKRCVTISYQSELTPNSVQAMNGIVSSAMGDAIAENSSDVVSIELTTDPETLLPYNIIRKQSSQADIGHAGKKWKRVVETKTTFRYN